MAESRGEGRGGEEKRERSNHEDSFAKRVDASRGNT